MGIWASKEPPPPMVLVPPLFDSLPLAVRTRMLESSYNLLFGKLALRCLLEDYFDQAGHFTMRIMLKPIDDPHVDLIANVSGPLDHKPDGSIVGDAQFRWQSDVDDPNTFMDLSVSNSDPILRIRSCAYFPNYRFGAFGISPLILRKRISPEDYGVMGLRYGSEVLSVGLTIAPFPKSQESFRSAWLVSKLGLLTVGVQYEPHYGRKDALRLKDLRNWSYAVGYGLGSSSPVSPSFNFCLELARSSQFIASFYQHFVVQRRFTKRLYTAPTKQVKNPFEENEIVGITNYIDFGFELQTRVDDVPTSNSASDSKFQIAASWQANKNFLLKGKVGTASSTLSLAFKSWWKPSFTCNISATRDREVGNTSFGFGIRVENLREASYQRADPNFVMLTPSKGHLAEGAHWKAGTRTMMQSDVKSGNFADIPKELRPFGDVWYRGQHNTRMDSTTEKLFGETMDRHRIVIMDRF